MHKFIHYCRNLTACSLGLSATSQQYFSLRTNQPAATSRNQPAVLFSQSKPAPAISHQPTEQALRWVSVLLGGCFWSLVKNSKEIKFLF
jgi:hypothetical protein